MPAKLVFAMAHCEFRLESAGYRHGRLPVPMPNTGNRVQGWVADDGSEDAGETYEAVSCQT
jgi:hypothetical protein